MHQYFLEKQLPLPPPESPRPPGLSKLGTPLRPTEISEKNWSTKAKPFLTSDL